MRMFWVCWWCDGCVDGGVSCANEMSGMGLMKGSEMKKIILIVFALLVSVANAQEMVPVRDGSGVCKKTDDGFCYEWRMTADRNIHFVGWGYEDGASYAFYRKHKGKYVQLLRVYPVLQDKRYPDQMFWGYPWDIRDIVSSRSARSVEVRAAIELTKKFDDSADKDIEEWIPVGQQRIPAVLFIGKTTQPDMTVDRLSYKTMALSELVKKAASKP